ncbi:MAG: type II toxin-antitoxin system RatA family toxin [Pseudomonadota bacterium]
MPKVDTLERIPHSARQMYDLVADIEEYPHFVPLCQDLNVLTRREKRGAEVVDARMQVGYKSIQETFVSRVVLRPDDLRIDVSYIDGPFEYLDNKWTFIPVRENSCDVDFKLDYKFKNRALALLMGSVFDKAFARVVGAFRERADEVYGRTESVS